MTVSNKKKTVSLRLPLTQYESAKRAAADAGLTLNGWLTMAVNSYLKNWKSPARAARQEQMKQMVCTVSGCRGQTQGVSHCHPSHKAFWEER